MNSKLIINVGLRSLLHHKMRSLLTTLGIIIGVVAIISVSSIGEGAKYKVKQQIENLGSNFIIVLAGAPKTRTIGGPRTGNSIMTLKRSDYHAVLSGCDSIEAASPGVFQTVTLIYEDKNWLTGAFGVNEQYPEIRNWPTTFGEFFSEQDVRSTSRVVLLGATVHKELFDNDDPCGKTIRINRVPYVIVGVLAPKGKRPDGRDEDDTIICPYTTIQRRLIGVTDSFSAFVLSIKSRDLMEKSAQEIRAILRQQHNLSESAEDDFTLFTQDEIAKASDAALMALNLLLMIIAFISLVVGGIGIMNIMLVTVTERVKEIGIRMALGATTTAILAQFLFEAVVICLFGGIIGTLLGIGLSYLVGNLLQWPIVISSNSIMTALGSSALIGLSFGYYPAHKASQLLPVDALADR